MPGPSTSKTQNKSADVYNLNSGNPLPKPDSTEKLKSSDSSYIIISNAKKTIYSGLDFLTMTEDDIKTWLAALPDKLKPVSQNSGNQWFVDLRARIWLTRIFTRTLQEIQATEELSGADHKLLIKWRNRCSKFLRDVYSPASQAAKMRLFLNQYIMDNKVTMRGKTINGELQKDTRVDFDLPDWNASRSKWPAAWRKVTEDPRSTVNGMKDDEPGSGPAGGNSKKPKDDNSEGSNGSSNSTSSIDNTKKSTPRDASNTSIDNAKKIKRTSWTSTQ
jgi:hypothetical protein